MATRNFTDPEGVAWTVWQVTPGAVLLGAPERRRLRSGEDRRVLNAAGFDPQMERRTGRDRRVSIAAPLQHGWLAFAAENGDRRRLAPVPPGWESATVPELRRYCRDAAPTPASHG